MSINRAVTLLVAFVATFASTTIQSGAQPTGGSFSCVLTFRDQTQPVPQHVSSLPTGEDITFDASVTDSTGSPATSGKVRIAVCKFHGESAPSHTCVSGGGHWRNLYGGGNEGFTEGFGDLAGHVLAFGGTSNIPATIGYRAQYFQGGGGVDAECEADFTWF